MSKHIIFWCALLLVVVAVIGACGAPPAQPTTPSESEAEGPPPTPTPIVAELGTGQLQLIYWHGLTGPDGVTMQAMVEQFVADNPDVSVRIEAMPWNIYFDKLLTAMVSGSPPDLFIVHEFATPGYARQGVLRDSADLYVSGGGLLPDDDFKPELLERLSYEGVRYGVPLDNLGWGVWVNRDLLQEAGFDPDVPPANGAEFIAMARALTIDENGLHPNEEGFDPNAVEQWGTIVHNPKNTYQSVLWQFGGDVFEGDTATLDQEAGLAAAQFLYDLIYTEHVSPPPGGFNALQAFGAGQLAIMPHGNWNLNFMRDSGINYGAWPMIQMGPVQPAARVSSHVLHMPTGLDGERLEATKRLVTYLSDNGLTWVESGQVPARFSVQDQLDPETQAAVIVFAEAFRDIGRLETSHPLKQELAAAWEPEIDGAWNDVASVQEALETGNRRAQDVLDRLSP